MNESTVDVRYFAAAESVAGKSREQVRLGARPTLGCLRAELMTRYGSDMERILMVAGFLVEGEFTRDLQLPIGRSVDIMPPFAGG